MFRTVKLNLNLLQKKYHFKGLIVLNQVEKFLMLTQNLHSSSKSTQKEFNTII